MSSIQPPEELSAPYRVFMRACAASDRVRRMWQQGAPASEKELLDEHLLPGPVLLAGCGFGREIPYLLHRGCQVVAVDFEPAMCSAAKQSYGQEGLRVECVDLSLVDTICPKDSCTTVVCMGLVSGGLFLPGGQTKKVLRALKAVLAPGGVLLMDFMAGPKGATEVKVDRFEWTGKDEPTISGLCAWPSRSQVKRFMFGAGFRCNFVPLLYDAQIPLVAAVARHTQD